VEELTELEDQGVGSRAPATEEARDTATASASEEDVETALATVGDRDHSEVLPGEGSEGWEIVEGLDTAIASGIAVMELRIQGQRETWEADRVAAARETAAAPFSLSETVEERLAALATAEERLAALATVEGEIAVLETVDVKWAVLAMVD
jgi:hypothetical protein